MTKYIIDRKEQVVKMYDNALHSYITVCSFKEIGATPNDTAERIVRLSIKHERTLQQV